MSGNETALRYRQFQENLEEFLTEARGYVSDEVIVNELRKKVSEIDAEVSRKKQRRWA